MKTTLTPEQSATLISKGISPDKASKGESEVIQTEQKYGDTIEVRIAPIFTLTDLLGLLPKEIVTDTIMCEDDICSMRINWDSHIQTWLVGYELVPHSIDVGVGSELIDALFSTLCWAIDNGHIDLRK